MGFPPQGGGEADVTSISANVATLVSRLTSARATALDELLAANLPTDVAANLAAIGSVSAIVSRGRPDMIFPSKAEDATPITLPASAADKDFPSVIVADLPSGLSIARADFVLVIGSLHDISESENQVDQAGKTIRVKKSTGNWATPADQMVALTFANGGLETPAGPDAYRGGLPLWGGIDISSIVTGNGTYNFRSEETNNSEGVTVTGASLELHDPFSVIRIWFN